MHREGAELAFTYQNERLLKNLSVIAKELDSDVLIQCDVSDDQSIKDSFAELSKKWDKFVHFPSKLPIIQRYFYRRQK